MSVIFILICFSLLVAVGFLAAFIWSVRSGQYNDTYTPSVRVLFDDKNFREVSSPRGREEILREPLQKVKKNFEEINSKQE